MNKKNKLNEKSKIPLIITIAAFLIPIALILGIIIGKSVNEITYLTRDSLSSWVSAIATVVIAILTIVLAKETWSLRDAQIKQLEELKLENIRPNVGIELKSSRVGVNFLDVNIMNHGKGIAKLIKFKFVDRDGNELSKKTNEVVKRFCKLAIFGQGIQSLGIGQVISSYLFSFIELSEALGNEDIFKPYFDIIIEFEDVEGTPYKNIFTIDFSQYKGMSELGSDPLYSISKNIESIKTLFSKIVNHTGNGKLSVDVYDSEDREKINDIIKNRNSEI